MDADKFYGIKPPGPALTEIEPLTESMPDVDEESNHLEFIEYQRWRFDEDGGWRTGLERTAASSGRATTGFMFKGLVHAVRAGQPKKLN